MSITLTDAQLIQAWSHVPTSRIKKLPPERGENAHRVNSARARILAIREREEEAHHNAHI